MRLLSTLAAAVVLAALALAACNSTETKSNRAGNVAGSGDNRSASVPTTASATPGHVAPPDGVKRVTTVELREALDKGTALVVDVRAEAAYQQNHVKSAISMPLEEVASRLSELPRNKMIVTYCS